MRLELTIGEVARRARVRPSALRYYESDGLLPAPHRINGQRRYQASILDQIAVIQLAQQAGFTIQEIHTLLSGFGVEIPPSERWRTLAQRKMAELDALVVRAQRMKQLLGHLMDCACPSLEECGKWEQAHSSDGSYADLHAP